MTKPLTMDKDAPANRRSFRVHFIRVHGPEKNSIVRILLVEMPMPASIYEGFGSWTKCRRWLKKLSHASISVEEWSVVRKRLDRKRLATIQEMTASLHDIDSMGLSRVDTLLGSPNLKDRA